MGDIKTIEEIRNKKTNSINTNLVEIVQLRVNDGVYYNKEIITIYDTWVYNFQLGIKGYTFKFSEEEEALISNILIRMNLKFKILEHIIYVYLGKDQINVDEKINAYHKKRIKSIKLNNFLATGSFTVCFISFLGVMYGMYDVITQSQYLIMIISAIIALTSFVYLVHGVKSDIEF